MGVLLACSLALPQALARSQHGVASAAGAKAAASEASVAGRSARSVVVSVRPATEGRLLRRIASRVSVNLRLVAAAKRQPPIAVQRVIAAGNRIARAPYSYGGGHGTWHSGGYDCSGSVSYALHGGRLLDTALASGALMSWGAPGPGRWITIYANPGHAFMVVAGRRFDTTGREQTGSRWQRAMRDTSGYVVRHPPGL